MSIAKHHAEWLSLIEVSGPFLSLPVLVQRFPQGMDAHDPEHAKALRQAHEEWDQDQNSDRPDPAIHRQWIDWVLRNTLDLGDVLVEGQRIPQTLKADLAEHGETLRPDKVVMEPDGGKARLPIQTYPLRQKLSRVVEGKPWAASPDTRMMQLLHDTGVRIGLVTNGDQWMLVDAPKGETTGYASWYASLWLEEPKTLQAFRTLLSSYRFFGVPEEETLERLLAQSAQDQQEVTDQLGYQVRQAVEVLVRTIDRANRDSGGALLKGVPEDKLYEAALTVMMRLVFLFCAEERDLLLLGDELYDKNYSVSTLREQLRVTATNFGEEVLERRQDAWSCLLTTFRAVYGGVQHHRLKLPAYQGELFDPDRFPFLEGRKAGTSWKDTPSQPIPVDNRTVLHLLDSLQVLKVRLPGGGPATPRKLSFRALSILQIGHVYEGLLDHTAVKATEPVLGLNGPRDHEPEVPLSRLEALAAKGEDELLAFVKEETGRSSVAPVKRLLATAPDDLTLSRYRTACQGDDKLWERIKPFAGLVRLDTFDYPVVILPRSVYITAGTDRRSSGTHYTPESLTEPIVRYTLEPLVYKGPAEGKPREQWRLKSAKELLDLKICDMACGSGAFLVQVCIYLAARLLEAWEEAERQVEGSPRITPYGEVSKGLPDEQLIPLDRQERLIYARRLVAERCIYGVDKNPLAVEMAKLSLWLLTLAKDKPFTFLDHAIRCGDSLVGLSSINQLLRFSMTEKVKVRPMFEQQRQQIEKRLEATMLLRKQIETLPSNTPQDIERKAKMFENAVDQTKRLTYAADMLLAATWEAKNVGELESALNGVLAEVEYKFKDLPAEQLEEEARKRLGRAGITGRFHWPLEFPEVFVDRAGFDAFACNPPFMGGQKITGNLGTAYRDYLVQQLARGKRGSADLCSYFFLRAARMLRSDGQLGFLATNTIAQGDTREVGLAQLAAEEYVIPRAVPSRPWPGTASLEVAHVWLRKGRWASPFVLEEKPVTGISSFLTEPGSVIGPPRRLAANAGRSFQGTIVLGMGFLLEPEEAQRLIDKNPRNKDVLYSFLNGEDFNSHPDQTPSRWVINFFDWPLDRGSAPGDYEGPIAADYPDCLAIIEEKVKPERVRNNMKSRRELWWQFGARASGLYTAIAGMEWVLPISSVSKHPAFAPIPTNIVFDHNLTVIAFNKWHHLAVVNSRLHLEWAAEYSSTLESRIGYRPSDCFETFPFPFDLSNLGSHGEAYHGHRRQIMLSRQEGLTKTNNRFHNPAETTADIQKLRDLHVEMDNAVAAAYGWSDLDLGHGFHETKQGMRFTISEPARREVLARLLKLNHERYAEEVAKGLHDKKVKLKAPRKSKGKASSEPSLFGEED
ncbi:MAG: Eco57I restriction-modification methylase domain-containing protein [Isosphaeraceae bacterium]